jgi:hypothetical protein
MTGWLKGLGQEIRLSHDLYPWRGWLWAIRRGARHWRVIDRSADKGRTRTMTPLTIEQHVPQPGLRERIGEFQLDADLIRKDPEGARTALDGCVVLRAELLWDNRIIYHAMHADFGVTPPAISPPRYEALLTKHPDGSVARVWRAV